MQTLDALSQILILTAIATDVRPFRERGKRKSRIEIYIRHLVYCRTIINLSIRDVIVHLSIRSRQIFDILQKIYVKTDFTLSYLFICLKNFLIKLIDV